VTCTAVCISHAAGAGGEEVGRLVAERLGFLYVDEEIVARAAARGGVRAAEVASEERRKSLAARVLEAIAQGGDAWAIGGSVPLGAGEELNSDDIRVLIRETIEQTAARGNAVIVAHAASHAVRPGPSVLRVLVTASPETRATRVASAEGLDQARSARAVKDSDAGRADYLKRFYDVGEELPTHYDLVFNTDTLSVEQAAELVSRAASG
jgi:cytidylate kinase